MIEYPTAFASWGPEESAAMERVIASGRFTMGQEVEAFEHEFAAYHGRRYGIMVNSGSSANLIMVAALFAKSEPLCTRYPISDRVIVPAIAWSTTYAPLVQHGLHLLVMDVDETWNAPPPKWFPEMNVRLIVGCSILGIPAYLEEWKKIADRLGAYFVEDNCESLGASINGKLCGTFGLMSSFSFFYSHQISGIEGGMILTDDEECARLCRVLRAHGWTRDVAEAQRFEDEYRFTNFGYNVRPLEMHAAVAREQLKKLPGFINERRKNASLFRTMARDLPITLPPWRKEPSPFGLQFTVDGGPEARRRLVRAFREVGIDCRLPTGGSFRKHAYGLSWANQPTPSADAIHDAGLFLGCAPFPIADKIEAAISVMRGVL